MSQKVYFFSDAHLGHDTPAVERKKEAVLVSFLRSLHGKADALYIVGDLFDFWFEYRSVVPRKHARVLFELYGLVASGVKVSYVAGNHDFWMGTYLSEEVGLHLCFDPVDVRHQGLLIHIAHGDGLMSWDTRYRLLKRVVRNPASVAAFRLLHPDLGALLARFVSHSSRGSGKPYPSPFRLDEGYLNVARQYFEHGWDAVIFGHVHHPVLLEEAGMLIVLGDWMKHFTYAVLGDGKFQLKRWGGKSPEHNS